MSPLLVLGLSLAALLLAGLAFCWAVLALIQAGEGVD